MCSSIDDNNYFRFLFIIENATKKISNCFDYFDCLQILIYFQVIALAFHNCMITKAN